jgi:outer membrane receptor protein involved in Fe transport
MKISMKLWREDNNGLFFNIQSKDQLGEIAFGALGLKPASFTKTGKPQFDDDLNQFLLGPVRVFDLFVSRRVAKGVELFGAVENLFDDDRDRTEGG